MDAHSAFVTTAEAAFIADLTDREMNRVVDEHILPDVLIRINNGRTFARVGAAFARIYFSTEQQLVANFRREIIQTLTSRLQQRQDKDLAFDLVPMLLRLDWRIEAPNAHFDFTVLIKESLERAQKVRRADSLVQEDPAVMGGLPVFSGTRVPIEIVLASLNKGIDKKRVVAAYSFLTDEHLDAARVYARVHPKRGRPRRILEVHPDWKVKSSRVVRPVVGARSELTTLRKLR